jgi:hypothetical protein
MSRSFWVSIGAPGVFQLAGDPYIPNIIGTGPSENHSPSATMRDIWRPKKQIPIINSYQSTLDFRILPRAT